jgi:hypothetical protein
VDRAVIATAHELFEARHYPGVIALISDALEGEPEHIEALVLRARANIALRRDLDAQADLRDIIRLDPQSGVAYRMLGQLAARRDENESAAIFFREALRLHPGDREAAEWLQILGATSRPAAVANKLPAPAAAAGRFPRARSGVDTPRTLSSPARAERPGTQPRFAKGTHAPDDERPTARRGQDGPTMRFGSADDHRPVRSTSIPSLGNAQVGETVTGRTSVPSLPQPHHARAIKLPLPADPDVEPPPQLARGSTPQPIRTLTGRPSRPITRNPVPEMPGFGEYLVDTGILTRERLRAAQAYQRSMKVQLSTAIVTLGLATPQRIEWAAVAHQSSMKR